MPSRTLYVQKGGEVELKVIPSLDEDATKQAAARAGELLGRETAGTMERAVGKSAATPELSQFFMQRFLGVSAISPTAILGQIFAGLGIGFSIAEAVKEITKQYREMISREIQAQQISAWTGMPLEQATNVRNILTQVGLTKTIEGQPNPYFLGTKENVEKLIDTLSKLGMSVEVVDGQVTEASQDFIDMFGIASAVANALKIDPSDFAGRWVPIQRELELTADDALDVLGAVNDIQVATQLGTPQIVNDILSIAQSLIKAGYSSETLLEDVEGLMLALPDLYKTAPQDIKTIAEKLAPTGVKQQLQLAALMGLPATEAGLEQLEAMPLEERVKKVLSATGRLAGGNELAQRLLIEQYFGIQGYGVEQLLELQKHPERITEAFAGARAAQPLAPFAYPTTLWQDFQNLYQKQFYGAYQPQAPPQTTIRTTGRFAGENIYVQPVQVLVPSAEGGLPQIVTNYNSINIEISDPDQKKALEDAANTFLDELDKQSKNNGIRIQRQPGGRK